MNWRNIFHWITVLASVVGLASVESAHVAQTIPQALPVAAVIGTISTVLHAVVKVAGGESLKPTDNTYHEG